jgi:chloride channel 3/4/5
MISVMVSKWVGDALGKEGIYTAWIALHKYPWLPTAEYRDHGETASSLMIPFERLSVVVSGVSTVEQLGIIYADLSEEE